MVGYLFGGNTNLSYDELQQKRKVANALAAQLLGSTPKNTGEGIGAILKGIGVGVANSRTNSAENANRSAATELFNSIIGGTSNAPPTAAQGMQASAATSGVNQEMSANTPSVNISGDKETFVSSLLPAAIEESKRTGVDPRIIVAQAAQETGWGRSAPGNNYFGIKSHGQGGGNSLMTHEYVDGKRVNVKDSFRAFESPADSVRGYGDFILKNPRYEKLRTSQGLDAQLQALQESGYATDPNYSRSVGAIAKGITLPEMAYNQTPTNNAANAIEAVAPQQRGISNGSDYNSPMMTYDDKGARVERPYGGNNLPALPVREIAPTPQVAQVQDRQQAPPNTPSQQNGVDPKLYQALANPWLNDGQKASIQAVIQQQQQAADRQANEQTWRQRNEYEQQQRQNDPAYQLNLKRTQVEIDQAMKPGYRVLQQEERTAFGIPPDDTRPYQVSREGQISAIGGMGQTQTPGVEARQREALAQQYGIDPQSAEGQRFILTGTLPTSDRGVTAGDREAIRDADEMINSGQATLSLLDRAMDLSGKAYEGVGAGTRALIGSQFGDEGALATREYDNIVTEQALGQLKSIFGGAPTEGERAILLEIQGSSSQPKSVRDNILKRARAAVERRVKFNQDRATELRGGTYYKPRESGQPQTQQATPQTAPQGAPNVDDLLKKYGQ